MAVVVTGSFKDRENRTLQKHHNTRACVLMLL